MNLKERHQLRNISELNFEHEKLKKSVANSGTDEKQRKLKQYNLELTRDCKVKTKLLDSLKQELKSKEKYIAEKEGEIKTLQHGLLKLQKDLRLDK
jgi:hypothetical protein